MNSSSKEKVKEIIERTKETGDNDGVLRDILFALKEMNLKKPQDSNQTIVLEGDKDNKERLFELKMEVKDLENKNNNLKDVNDKLRKKYDKLKNEQKEREKLD